MNSRKEAPPRIRPKKQIFLEFLSSRFNQDFESPLGFPSQAHSFSGYLPASTSLRMAATTQGLSAV
jgi:hypothetical protein